MNLTQPPRIRTLRGPNTWARAPVLDVTILGSCAGIAETVLQLQREVGCRVAFHRTLSAGRFAVEYEDAEVGRLAVAVALGHADKAALADLADSVLLGVNTRALHDAALRRGIPVRRLDRGSLLQLGWGVHQRRLCGAFTDRTSSIGESIGWNKPLAKELLCAAGVPVPEGRRVADAEDAWNAAQEFGGVVVVKPEAANHGRGVFIGLETREEIGEAFTKASGEAENPNVIVERCVSGSEHRVLVIDGVVAAAARGDALYVIGDARRTIQELMDEVNLDPRRGYAPEAPLSPVGPDEVTLATLQRQGYDAASVPAQGARVLIQRNGNMSTDVTDLVCPENQRLAALAARAVGLDVAGVDLVADDISRPLHEQRGGVLEVNAMPGLMMHLHPGVGLPRPVDEMIVLSLYPAGGKGRIPIIAVSVESAAELCLRISSRLEAAGLCTGVACKSGLFVTGQAKRSGNRATSHDIFELLLHPLIEAAVVEVTDEAVVNAGLGFDCCDVVIFDGEPRTDAQRVLYESLNPGGITIPSSSAEDCVDWAVAAARR